MKNIYVAVSSLNTRVGKFKSTLTEYPYNHVSVSFSRGLSRMYSFSRQLHDVPLVGGFTEELPSRILSGGGDVPLMLYELEVDDEEYGRI